MKLKKHLSFASLRKALSACFNQIPEYRQTCKIDYSIHDIFMSGFACMHFQDPSLLQFQKRLEEKHHTNNLKTLFGMQQIPESTQLRTVINEVDSDYLSAFFDEYIYRLQRGKHLVSCQLFPSLYLLPLDATDYFSSTAISCSKCLQTKVTSKNKKALEHQEETKEIRYSHKALQVAIMHPDKRQVIPLMPEEIRNEDGATKQDCEINAAKRLLPKIRKAHPHLGIIMTGDDLFSRQPMIEATQQARMHYIYVAKPTSHPYLMEWLAVYPHLQEKAVIDADKNIRHGYQWMNEVPLQGGEKAIHVNYFSYQMITLDKKEKEIIRPTFLELRLNF